MKKLIFAIATLTLIFVSCSKDEEKTNSYTFIDQNLQGKIGGNAWTFVAGNAEDSYFTEGNLSIDLYPSELDTPCGFIWDVDYVMFEIPKEVGIYELYFDLSSFDGYTVTLFETEGTMNNIATEGAVEIISIDETSGTITGRMDVRADGDNQVNGNFTITYCTE